MIDLAPLRYFQSAYEAGTFSAAARMNAVSQPSVSAAIARLEDHFGGKLFLRGRDGLAPTALGHELYQQSGAVLAQLKALDERLTRRVPQVVRVHCQPDVFTAPFEPGLRALQRDRTAMAFHFTDDAGRADLLLCSEDCVPAGFGFHMMWEDTYGVALPRGHVLSVHSALSLQDLEGEPIIARPYCPTADRFLLHGYAGFTVSAEAVHDAQLLDLVAAGLGIALVPLSHAAAHAGIRVLPIQVEEPVLRRVGVACRKTAFAADLARAFLAAR